MIKKSYRQSCRLWFANFFTILGASILATTLSFSPVFANSGDEQDDQNEPVGVFFQSGLGDCGLDCSEASSVLKGEVLRKANERCLPLFARQVSNWEAHIQNYGRVRVTAAFRCEH